MDKTEVVHMIPKMMEPNNHMRHIGPSHETQWQSLFQPAEPYTCTTGRGINHPEKEEKGKRKARGNNVRKKRKESFGMRRRSGVNPLHHRRRLAVASSSSSSSAYK